MSLKHYFSKIIFFYLTCWISLAQAQDNVVVGILDEYSLNAIPGATVLVDIDGSRYTRIGDENGRIILDLGDSGKIKRLYLTAQHISYQEKGLLITGDSLKTLKTLKTLSIYLRPADKRIDEITVTAQELSITRNLEKTIVHVKESSILKNATLTDVLNLSPGVAVNNNSVSLFGKPGTKILVDGQPVSLGGRDLQDYLNATNTSNIDRLEITSTPGAQENASSSSGIINIITKKNLDQADINASLGRGTDWKSNLGANYGRKLGKFNIGLNLNRFTNRGLNTYRIDQLNELDNLNIRTDARTPFDTEVYNYGATVSHKINPNHELLFKYSGDYIGNGYNSTNRNGFGKFHAPLDSSITTETGNNLSNRNHKFLLSYVYNVDTSGQVLKAELFQNNYRSDSESDVENIYNNFERDLERFIFNEGWVRIRFNTYRLDYTLPFQRDWVLSAGAKFSDINTKNSLLFKSSLTDVGSLEIDRDRSQDFVYREGIWASYAEIKKSLKKIELKVGARLEGADVDGRLIDNNVEFSRSYIDFFPHASVQYRFNDKSQMLLNYGRYINRPTFQDLNPFVYYTTPYFYAAGNQDLMPEYSNNIELTFIRNSLTLSGGIRLTNNQFVYINRTDRETNVTRTTLENLGRTNNYYLSAYYPLKINSWWNTNFNATVFRNEVSIPDNPSDITSLNSMTGQVVTNFQLSKSMRLNFSGNYNSPMLYGTYKMKGVYTVNGGLSYSLLDQAMSLSLSARDIFNSAHSSFRGRYYDVVSDNRSTWESRQFTLSVSYIIKKRVFNFRYISPETEESRIKQ